MKPVYSKPLLKKGLQFVMTADDLVGDFLKLDGSNANTTIDIQGEDLTTTGDITAGNLAIPNWNTAYTHSQLVTGNPHNVTYTQVGADPAGTDNSTNVTLAGTPDYLTLSGQEITLGLIDLATDVTGLLPAGNIADAYLLNTGDTGVGAYTFRSATDSTTAFQIQQVDTTPVFNVDTVNKFVIINDRLGIGTSAPLTKLHISATTSPTLRISEGGSTTSYLEILDTDVTRAQIQKLNPAGNVVIDIDPKPGGTFGAGFRFFRTTNTTALVSFDIHKGNNTTTLNHRISGNSSSYMQVNTGNLSIGGTTARSILTTYGSITPVTNNVYDIGSSTYKWDDIYATNGTIITSDRDKKEQIEDSDLGLDFINALRPVSFKWKDYINTDEDEIELSIKGKDGVDESYKTIQITETPHVFTRPHYGMIAQEVEELLDGKDFAGLIKNDDGYGLRYNEFISPMVKAIQELYIIIETQQARLNVLESL